MNRSSTGTKTGTGTETLLAEMSSSWKEKYDSLTIEEHERVRAAIISQPTLSDPNSLLQALKLAYKQIKDMPAAADEPPSRKSFALDNLEEVAEEYDELCQKYKDE